MARRVVWCLCDAPVGEGPLTTPTVMDTTEGEALGEEEME